MKTALLIFFIFIIYCIYKVRKFIKEIISPLQNTKQVKSHELKKDPKTGIYKPKK